MALGYGGRSLLSMLSMLALARLLEPKAFGLVALASTLLLVLGHIQNAGVGAAFVYRREGTDEAASSAFAFAALTGLAMGLASVAAAPLLALLFHTPGLTDVLRPLSALLVLRGLGVVPSAILERNLDFRTRVKAELGAGVVQIGVSLGMAAAGLGVWSLVGGQLAGTGYQTGAVWLLVCWRPSLRLVRRQTLRELTRYGRFVSAGNLLDVVNSTLDNVTVARLLGTSALGLYSVTFRLADFPTDVIGHVVGRVMFPAYAQMQEDLAAFRRAFVQNLQRVAFLALPISVGLIVAAEPIVLGLLGPRWHAAVTAMRILALYSLVRSFASPCGAVFQASGRPQLVPLLALPHALVVVPALVLLVPRFGVTGAAVAMVVAFSASAIPALVVALRLLHLPLRELARSLSPALACSATLGVALALLLPPSRAFPAPVSLAFLAACGIAVYVGSAATIARSTLRPMLVALRSRPSRTT